LKTAYRASGYFLAALLLCGCAICFREKDSLVNLPAQLSPATFDMVLMTTTRWVEFDGLQNENGQQRLRISMVNRGRSTVEVRTTEGNFLAKPNNRVVIYDSVPGRTNSVRIRVGVQHRTRCEFQLEASNPSEFGNAIRIYTHSSSAPL
jgi:hypothetical protein